MKKTLDRKSWGASVLVALLAGVSASAGTFSNNFNSLQLDPNDPNSFLPPDGTSWFGSIQQGISGGYDLRTGGTSNSGVLKLVNNTGSQQSAFIINNLDNGQPFVGFDMTFNMLIGGGTGADGLSFFVGDFADGSYGEEGPAAGQIQGLTVSIDIYNNGGTVAEAPAVDLKWNGNTFAHRLGTPAIGALPTTLQSGTAFWPVKLHADPDGTVDLVINNVIVYTNLPVFHPIPDAANAMRFGFSARTGGSTMNGFIDDLNITTVVDDPSAGQPYITSISPVNPIDQNASVVGGVSFTLQDSTYTVDQSTIKLSYNGTVVTPVIVRTKSDPNLADPDQTVISYFGNGGLLPSGAGTARLQYSTTSSPAVANDYSFSFTVAAAANINPAFAVSGVDVTKPGFKARVNLIDTHRGPGDANIIVNAERQLADGYKDWDTHAPYTNYANLNPDPSLGLPIVNADGWFEITNVINFNLSGDIGNFQSTSVPPRPDEPFPGIPGIPVIDHDGDGLPDFTTAAGATENFVVEFTTYLDLKKGGYRFGVNSDDGFVASFGNGQDAAGNTIVGSFSGGRGSADSVFDVVIGQDGVYPFRLAYWQGGGGANCELFVIDPTTSTKILINDPDDTRAPRAYQEATGGRPSIQSVLPVQGDVAAFPNDDVVIKIRDGAIAADDSTVQVAINGAAQTVTKSRTGKVLTVTRPGSIDNLLPSGLNTVNVIYGYNENNASVLHTNTYTFNVAPYYNAIPAANKVAVTDINTADTGFHARYTQMDRSKDANQGNGGRISGNGDGNRMPAPEQQLWGLELNPVDGQPYPNLADPGVNGDYTANFDLFNFRSPNDTGNVGMFSAGAPVTPLPGSTGYGAGSADATMPGLKGSGTSNTGADNYVMETTTYLQLKKGVYVFGVNSDDGYVVSSAPNAEDTLGTLLGFADFGRGSSGNLVAPTGTSPYPITPGVNTGSTPFSVVVPEDGIYPFRVLYWQGGGGVNAEFYTLNQDNRTVTLVNDTAAVDVLGRTPPNMVPAFRTYTGPAKEWVKFSISPNPWDNRVQQSGPGPLAIYGRTTNNVNSSDIYNWADVYPAQAAGNSAHWADVVIGAVVANAATGGTADAGLRLLLDGAEVPATKTVNGTDVTIAYKPSPILASGSSHIASLVYAGVTNSWPFKVQSYATLNASDKAAAAGDPNARGFSMKLVQAGAARTGGNTAAAAEAQLGGLAGQADVSVPGPEAGGRYIVPGVINFSNNNNNNPSAANAVGVGNFQRNVYGPGWPFEEIVDNAVPGLTGGGTGAAATREQFTAEIFAYLEFPAAGYYRLGGNVDDGMFVKIGTPGVTNGMVLFTQDRGAGAADIPFSVYVPQAGLYPVRFVWYQGTGGAQAEFFSYDENGNKIPINDATNPNAIKAYYALQGGATGPQLTVTKNGDNIVITWTGGGELQSATDIAGPWAGSGNTTGTDTESATTGTKFFRVKQ
jgi:hypothetical protein